MAWFLVETADERDFVSKYDPDPKHPTKWILHPPEPYLAAKIVARKGANFDVDLSDVDPDSEEFIVEFMKRRKIKDPVLPMDLHYEWCLLGLSKIKPPKGKAITTIDLDLLHRVPHDIVMELANEIEGMATVDAVTEKNSGSPSDSKD
jgi:hypothetical protein